MTLRLSRDEEELISDQREKLVLSCIQTLQELSDSWTPPRRYWTAVSKMVLERRGKKTGKDDTVGYGNDAEFHHAEGAPNPADIMDAPPPGIGEVLTAQTAAAPRVDWARGFIAATTVPENVTSQEPLAEVDMHDSQLISDMLYWPEFQLHLGSDLVQWDCTGLEPSGRLDGSWGQDLSWPPL